MKLLLATVAATLLIGAASTSAQNIATTPAVMLSQQKAVDRYPDIGVKGSDLNLTFLDIVEHWKVWKKEILQRDDWPELVAAEAVATTLARRREEERRNKQVVEIRERR